MPLDPFRFLLPLHIVVAVRRASRACLLPGLKYPSTAAFRIVLDIGS